MKKPKKYKRGKVYLAGIILSSTIILYGFGLASLHKIGDSKATHLRDKSHAEQVLRKEQRKLRIEGKNIELIFGGKYDDEHSEGYARKTGRNSYLIHLSPQHLDDVTLKHEVYHIADGHVDSRQDAIDKGENKLIQIVKYFFSHEPQAIIYSALDIKL